MVEYGINRRQALKTFGSLSAVGATGIAGCLGGSGPDDFPSDDIDLYVPYGPGGGYDTYARLVAPYLEEELDTTVNVENIEGGEGQLGTREVYEAEPDGYTLGIMNVEQFARDQIIADVQFDLTEMTWFATIAENVTSIAVASGIDFSWDDYVQGVQDGELALGTQSYFANGTLAPLLVGEMGGLYDPNQILDNLVIYSSRGDMIPALERGDIQIIGGTLSSVFPYHESGDVEVLMVLTDDEEPPEDVPDAATLASEGIDNASEIAEINTPIRAFSGPPDIPDEERQILEDAFEAAITNKELQEEAEEADRPITYRDPDATADSVTTSVSEWKNREELLRILEQASE